MDIVELASHGLCQLMTYSEIFFLNDDDFDDYTNTLLKYCFSLEDSIVNFPDQQEFTVVARLDFLYSYVLYLKGIRYESQYLP